MEDTQAPPALLPAAVLRVRKILLDGSTLLSVTEEGVTPVAVIVVADKIGFITV